MKSNLNSDFPFLSIRCPKVIQMTNFKKKYLFFTNTRRCSREACEYNNLFMHKRKKDFEPAFFVIIICYLFFWDSFTDGQIKLLLTLKCFLFYSELVRQRWHRMALNKTANCLLMYGTETDFFFRKLLTDHNIRRFRYHYVANVVNYHYHYSKRIIGQIMCWLKITVCDWILISVKLSADYEIDASVASSGYKYDLVRKCYVTTKSWIKCQPLDKWLTPVHEVWHRIWSSWVLFSMTL